jgi:hypothetical protein
VFQGKFDQLFVCHPFLEKLQSNLDHFGSFGTFNDNQQQCLLGWQQCSVALCTSSIIIFACFLVDAC